MRTLVVVLAVSIAMAVVTIGVRWAKGRSTTPELEAAHPGEPDRNAELARDTESRLASIQELQRSIDLLAARVAKLESVDDGRTSIDARETSELPPAAGDPDPRVDLERYVASFAGGTNGIELYRMQVEAHAPELLREICALVSDTRRPDLLRVKLAEIVGDARFRGNQIAIDTSLGVLPEHGTPALANAALRALREIGDARITPRLEALVWHLEGRDLQQRTIECIVAWLQPDGNAALQRLFDTAPGVEEMRLILSMLSDVEQRTALAVIGRASTMERDVRLAAANEVGAFHSSEAVALIDDWLSVERDEQVRAVLKEARSRASTTPRWSPSQATGEPDADPRSDTGLAWAAQPAEGGLQWLDLTFPVPMRAHGVRVFEVVTGGGVAEVIAIDEAGRAHTVWSGSDATSAGACFEIAFDLTAYRVSRVRLVIDTNRSAGWEEIDAVELLGPSTRAWSSHATASSYYGQQSKDN